MEFANFSKFGIDFKRLSPDNLETVRCWRNSEDVRPYMQYQKIISPDEHLKWYQELDDKTNFYCPQFFLLVVAWAIRKQICYPKPTPSLLLWC